MKKLINRPEAVVQEMIEGFVAAYPGLQRLPGHSVLIRGDLPAFPERPVAVVSGGGSGHEPAHAGYVGRGMLSAAVAGEVFTSPSPDTVLAAIRATSGPLGALLIVKNYTGDRLNFGLAAEMARAEGIPVEIVLVADDVAMTDSVEHAGRRGLAGTVLVHKVAGAAAESGASLAEATVEAREAAAAVRTMGVALSACTVPAAGRPSFSLAEGEVELGLGIHGEPGVRRGPMEPADVLVDRLLEAILAEKSLSQRDRVVLLVNNLGATPLMELAIVTRRAVAVLRNRGLMIERVYLGTFLSALEMAGVSLSVLSVDEKRLARLDFPTEAPAWTGSSARPLAHPAPLLEHLPVSATPAAPMRPQTQMGASLELAIQTAAKALLAESPRLTQMDQMVGDGDLGISLERGARALLRVLPTFPLDDPSATLHELSLVLQRALGGTSGPLYAGFFLRAAGSLRHGEPESAQTWAEAFRAGCAGIAELGGAARGDRTMLDALLPAAQAFQEAVHSGQTVCVALQAAATAALAGAKATANMMPRRGRSSYLGARAMGHADPGAEAVAVWLGAVCQAAI